MDRLSALPDEMIIHILSLLPDPKTVVQTSILAKGWRFHWSRVPSIGFTKLLIPNTDTNQTSTIWSFFLPLFGFQIPTNPISCLNIFHNYLNTFHITPTTNHEEFASWIAAHNIRNLVISLNNHAALPPCLSTSQPLLHSLCIVDWACTYEDEEIASNLYFPALKNLQLVNLAYSQVSISYLFVRCMSLRRPPPEPLPNSPPLLSRCPVLEELTIRRMNTKICVLCSDSRTLTRLAVDIQNSKVLVISIPSLKYIRLHVSKEINGIYVWAQPLLIEVDIDLMNIKPGYFFSLSVLISVTEMYNVKSLALSTRPLWFPTFLFFAELDPIKFNNLTQLNLRTDWRFITHFLQNSDNLRVLTIFCEGTQNWIEPKRVPECLVSHLETVNLVDFGWCTEPEFDMLKYILRNAKVLKKMEIICTPHYQLDHNVKLEAIKRFATIEIGSATCELVNFTLDAGY